MDRCDRALSWLRLRHSRVQLRSLRGAQERHRLGLSRMESQGGCIRELTAPRWAQAASSSSVKRRSRFSWPDSLIGPHPCHHLVGSLHGRRCRGRTGGPRATGQGNDRRSAVVHRGPAGDACQRGVTPPHGDGRDSGCRLERADLSKPPNPPPPRCSGLQVSYDARPQVSESAH